MKRWGTIAFVVVGLLAGWLIARGRADRVTPAGWSEPRRAIDAGKTNLLGSQAGRELSRRASAAAPSAVHPPAPWRSQPPVPEPEHWRKEAHDYRERILNLKPERVAEIEAVAPRLHLSADVVEKLSRWSDTSRDLIASAYADVETESDYRRAEQHAVAIAAAHSKAEMRLLGGLDNWNRFGRLKAASMTGTLDSVDDDGETKSEHRGRSQETISSSDGFIGRASKPDTRPYDHYFE